MKSAIGGYLLKLQNWEHGRFINEHLQHFDSTIRNRLQVNEYGNKITKTTRNDMNNHPCEDGLCALVRMAEKKE